MIKMMCGVRLISRVSNDILRERVGAVVKTENMLIHNYLRWYSHVC